jgi:ubiquinone/menaquinone biosynthesis C-methylase UbiE
MSISSYFMSKFYDASMRKMEAASLAGWRKELLSEVSGDVIEIGSGTGVNLQYYRDRVKSVTLTEADGHMCDILLKRLRDLDDDRFSMVHASAENLRFDDGSFDAAVVTLVLCSVDDQLQVLEEIKRVLRPGGKIYFIEHVLAKHEPKLIKWQKLLQPVWVCACGSCHLTRDTGNSIAEAGFRIERLENRMSGGCPAVVASCITGIAIAA